MSDIEELKKEVKRLADIQEIKKVICGVSLFADLWDFDKARSFYTNDCTLDYSSMMGPDATRLDIKGFWESVTDFLPGFKATLHQTANFQIEVDGDRAHAISLVRALHLVDGETSENGGCYRHDMVRTPDGWRIKHQTYEIMFTKDDVFGLIEKARANTTKQPVPAS